MKNKKLSGKEIIEIAQKYTSIDSFVEGDYNIPEDFKFSEEVKILRKLKNQAWEDYNKAVEGLTYAEKQNNEYILLYNKWRDIENPSSKELTEFLGFIGLGEIEEVEQYGGEDMGSEYYVVQYFKDHDVYIRTDGYYSSYNGTDWEDGYGCEVRPKEKTITVYE